VAGFFGIGSARAAVLKGEAVAVTVSGAADYSVDGKEWKPLRANDTLKPGMEVRTATGAKVDLFLNYNGPLVIVQSSSHLVISKLDREEISGRVVTDTELNVKAGSIIGYTQKMAPSSQYKIKNQLGDVFITGTIYQVYASGYVYCQSGEVNVRYSPKGVSLLGNTVDIFAGFYFDPVSYSSTTIPPDTSDTLLATVEATIGNIRKFNLSRGRKLTVEVLSL
jgi:hypothetical protein